MWIKVSQIWTNTKYVSNTKDYDQSNSVYQRDQKKKKKKAVIIILAIISIATLKFF